MAEEKITPLNGHVLIHYEPLQPEKTASGLYLGKPKNEGMPDKGKVYAIAPDVDKVAIGDYIIFKYNMNKGVHFKDLKLILVPIDDVVGIITED